MIETSPRPGAEAFVRPAAHLGTRAPAVQPRPSTGSSLALPSFGMGFQLAPAGSVVNAPGPLHHLEVIEVLRQIQKRAPSLDATTKPAPPRDAPTLSSRQLDFIVRIMNAIENNDHSESFRYGAVMRYRDGSYRGKRVYQYTLSVGFTELGGNLRRVLERYQRHGGKLAKEFQPFIDGMNGTPMAPSKTFEALLRRASSEKAMKQAQHEIFAERYLAPAIRWGEQNGFEQPLSYLVIIDSFLHSGSILPFLRRRFSERPPAAGGTERGWIRAYSNARYQWLKNHSNRILRNTAFRAHTWMSEMNQNNWFLEEPVEASDPLGRQRWTVQPVSRLPRFP